MLLCHKDTTSNDCYADRHFVTLFLVSGCLRGLVVEEEGKVWRGNLRGSYCTSFTDI